MQERVWLELYLGAHGSRGEESVYVRQHKGECMRVRRPCAGSEHVPAFSLHFAFGHDTSHPTPPPKNRCPY